MSVINPLHEAKARALHPEAKAATEVAHAARVTRTVMLKADKAAVSVVARLAASAAPKAVAKAAAHAVAKVVTTAVAHPVAKAAASGAARLVAHAAVRAVAHAATKAVAHPAERAASHAVGRAADHGAAKTAASEVGHEAAHAAHEAAAASHAAMMTIAVTIASHNKVAVQSVVGAASLAVAAGGGQGRVEAKAKVIQGLFVSSM